MYILGVRHKSGPIAQGYQIRKGPDLCLTLSTYLRFPAPRCATLLFLALHRATQSSRDSAAPQSPSPTGKEQEGRAKEKKQSVRPAACVGGWQSPPPCCLSGLALPRVDIVLRKVGATTVPTFGRDVFARLALPRMHPSTGHVWLTALCSSPRRTHPGVAEDNTQSR